MEVFCDRIDFDISLINTKIAFFTPQNGLSIYEVFTCNDFPKYYVSDEYKAGGYFDGFLAQAFIGEKYYGILIRTDLPCTYFEYFKIIMHELSHIFCTVNELDGEIFFDKYCCGAGVEDGIINAGYAIWRETVADIMADSILLENTEYYLPEVKKAILSEYRLIKRSNPCSKRSISTILSILFNTKELGAVSDWSAVWINRRR